MMAFERAWSVVKEDDEWPSDEHWESNFDVADQEINDMINQTGKYSKNPTKDRNICYGCGERFIRGDNAFGNRSLTGCRKCIDKVAHKGYKWLHPKEGEETGPEKEGK